MVTVTYLIMLTSSCAYQITQADAVNPTGWASFVSVETDDVSRVSPPLGNVRRMLIKGTSLQGLFTANNS